MEYYRGKKVLVLGLGISGKAAVQLLLDSGASVWAVDENAVLLEHDPEIEALRRKGLNPLLYRNDLESQELSLKPKSRFREHSGIDALLTEPVDFSLVILSPGIPQTHPVCTWAVKKGIPVIGEVELALRHINGPVLAITGTNGKTTVTLLVTHVLQQAGIPAKALGNIGVPLCSQVGQLGKEVVVCELSSYQIETLSSKKIDCGVILNITPDHLDRYQTMDAYARAKINIEQAMRTSELYISAQVMRDYGDYFTQKPKVFDVKENIELLLPECYRGRGTHDLENVLAAYALCRYMGVSNTQFCKALESFKKPPHRIEFVRNVRGVAFYDDSKGTNLDAVIRAVDSLEGAVILIAGGVAKGCSFARWRSAFAGKVKCICAIGEAKEQIIKELSETIPIEKCSTLLEAVNKAFSLAKQGENVLLSPGCASFDMFKNYEHRGRCFSEHVFALDA